MKLYIAYGSNLNRNQMSHRCPDAYPLGKTTMHGKLVFRRGVATIEPSVTGKVPVGIWAISSADEKRLDVYEGFPRLYRKEYYTVKMDGELHEALIYIMNEGHDISAPSPYYYHTIERGYRDFGMDTEFLEVAAARCGYDAEEYA